MADWTQEMFEAECQAWVAKLRDNPRGNAEVCVEFSKWSMSPNSNKYLFCKMDNSTEVHIVWSPSYRSPVLLLRDRTNPHREFTLNYGFVGGLDFHPLLCNEIFFSIHACETKRNFKELILVESTSGVRLLQWYALMMNGALNFDFSSALFQLAKTQL